jgi:hypothetical protein
MQLTTASTTRIEVRATAPLGAVLVLLVHVRRDGALRL